MKLEDLLLISSVNEWMDFRFIGSFCSLIILGFIIASTIVAKNENSTEKTNNKLSFSDKFLSVYGNTPYLEWHYIDRYIKKYLYIYKNKRLVQITYRKYEDKFIFIVALISIQQAIKKFTLYVQNPIIHYYIASLNNITNHYVIRIMLMSLVISYFIMVITYFIDNYICQYKLENKINEIEKKIDEKIEKEQTK